MLDFAYAMGKSGETGGGGYQGLISLTPLILMFVIFYILLIRPQQKKAKQHKQFLDELKKNDQVVTSGGIHGKITGLTENIVTLEIADKVKIKDSRSQISGKS